MNRDPGPVGLPGSWSTREVVVDLKQDLEQHLAGQERLLDEIRGRLREKTGDPVNFAHESRLSVDGPPQQVKQSVDLSAKKTDGLVQSPQLLGLIATAERHAENAVHFVFDAQRLLLLLVAATVGRVS